MYGCKLARAPVVLRGDGLGEDIVVVEKVRVVDVERGELKLAQPANLLDVVLERPIEVAIRARTR
jgi:hypothetical protein